MPELVLLLVGEWHEDECAKDEDFAWCRSAPGSRLARAALGRRGRAAHPLRRRRDPAVPRRAVQRRGAALPDPEVRAARPPHDLPGARGRAHVGPRGDDGGRRRRVRRRAAGAGGGTRRARHGAARMGVGADRRARQRAAVGAPARAWRGLERPAGR